jgi:hypothetical protein
VVDKKPEVCARCRRKIRPDGTHECLTLEERRDRILAEHARELDLEPTDDDLWGERRDLA